jgi:hypothetical protein
MHRDKTVARIIIIILSVIHVAAAAPVIVSQRSQEADEDVTPVQENRGNPGDTPQDLYPVPQMDNEPPTTSGIPPSQDPSPELVTPQLYNDPTPTSGAPPSQDETSPAPGDPPYNHNDPPAGSNDPKMQNDPPSVSEAHNDLPPTSEILPVHDDLPVQPGSGKLNRVWQWLNDDSGESWSHVDSEVPLWPDSGSKLPPSKPPSRLFKLEAPSTPDDLPGSGKLDRVSQWLDGSGESWSHVDSEVPTWPDTGSKSPPSRLFELKAPSTPEAKEVFSDAMKQKLKVLAGFGVVAGVSAGLVYGIHKDIKDHSHGEYVSAFSLPLLPASN